MTARAFGVTRGAATCLVGALLLSMASSSPAAPGTAEPATDITAAHTAEIDAWRERRDQRLRSEDGWLTLVGLEWLNDGANSVGSGAGNRIRLPGGPEVWGTVFVTEGEIRFAPAPNGEVTVNGEPAQVARLVPAEAGTPTVVRSGDLSFHVIHRESYALRVQDRQAATRLNFEGIEHFVTRHDWRIDARFVAAPPDATIEVGDVLGHVSPMPVLGYIEFERDGRMHRLVGVGEPGAESLWFIFADRTNGRQTYGAGRFVYSEGMPVDGRLVVDFNKAYNPPCAFTEFSTCPLPPQQNRLDLAVTAGEKMYPPAGDGSP